MSWKESKWVKPVFTGITLIGITGLTLSGHASSIPNIITLGGGAVTALVAIVAIFKK